MVVEGAALWCAAVAVSLGVGAGGNPCEIGYCAPSRASRGVKEEATNWRVFKYYSRSHKQSICYTWDQFNCDTMQ